MLCVGLQFLLSSFLWNHFMFHYHILLETDILFSSNLANINSNAILVTQNQILKSSSMWMVSYFWRLVNPQTMTQYQLLALLYSKECELVRFIYFWDRLLFLTIIFFFRWPTRSCWAICRSSWWLRAPSLTSPTPPASWGPRQSHKTFSNSSLLINKGIWTTFSTQIVIY